MGGNEISHIRVVRRNSCRQSYRPIFYFVPEETQRHLCHKPKTRYVSSGLRMEPCSVSKPFIETIDERDLLNSTAPFLLLPLPSSLLLLLLLFPRSTFFRRWQSATLFNPQRKTLDSYLHRRLIYILSNLVPLGVLLSFFLPLAFFYSPRATP